MTLKIKKLAPSVVLGLLLPFFPAEASFGAAIDPGLEAALSAASPAEEIPVIIDLADRVAPNAFRDKDKILRRRKLVEAYKSKADLTQRPVVAFLRGVGAKRLKSIWLNNRVVATLKADAIRSLAARPGIDSIRLDATLAAPVTTMGATAPAEWNLNAIHAPELWSLGYDGTGAVVAGMDTGVDVNHPDLAGGWRGGTNSWFDPNGEHATPSDTNGHGTQTMSIMVGGATSGSTIGAAPGAKWIAAKIFNDAGLAYLSSIHLGFQWALDPDNNALTDDAPDVVSNSWGFRDNINACVTEFSQDVQALKAAGIAVVFAGGNEGPNPSTSVSPANYPESAAVGAVDEALAVAGFSSRGPSACDGSIYPEVASPGVNVRSADLTYGGIFPNSYRFVSGTSFAASHLAGTIAALSAAVPTAPVADIEAALRDTSADLDQNGPDNGYGYGLIDAFQAYNRLASTTAPPVNDAPQAVNDAATTMQDAAVTIDALANDTDPDGDALSIASATNGANGVTAVNADNTITYTPNPGYYGVDAFAYAASDGALASNTAAVTVTVAQRVNAAPVAANDLAATRRNRAVTIKVLANDTDSDGTLDPATVAVIVKPTAGGTAVANANGSITYTPKLFFRGTDIFTYIVKDNLGAVSNQARVTVLVTK